MIGNILSMMCENFHMKYQLGMTANQRMKRPMYRFSETMASPLVYKEYGQGCQYKKLKHGLFH